MVSKCNKEVANRVIRIYLDGREIPINLCGENCVKLETLDQPK